MNLLETESFEETFGPKKKRKKPKIQFNDYEDFKKNIDNSISRNIYYYY